MAVFKPDVLKNSKIILCKPLIGMQDSLSRPKTQSEAYPINFDFYDESLSYNFPISLTEIYSTIHKNLRNASPEPDNIYASSWPPFCISFQYSTPFSSKHLATIIETSNHPTHS